MNSIRNKGVIATIKYNNYLTNSSDGKFVKPHIMRNFCLRKNLKSPETINIHAPTDVGENKLNGGN